MDEQSQIVTKFLQTISEIQAQLEELGTLLEKQREVKKATVWYFRPKFFETLGQSNSGFGLSVDLHDTTIIDWWFELWWSDHWMLEHNVYQSDPKEHGSHDMVNFPDVECTGLEELITQLKQAMRDLMDTVEDQYPFIKDGARNSF